MVFVTKVLRSTASWVAWGGGVQGLNRVQRVVRGIFVIIVFVSYYDPMEVALAYTVLDDPISS